MKRLDSTREFVGQRGGANLSEGYAAVFTTIVIWSTPSLFQYYLIRYYDPWAQNFYRYSVACLAIAPFVVYRMQQGGPRFDWRSVLICFAPCVPNVVHQVTQVVALVYMGPGVYAIFTRSSVIFTALLALAFFPEERHVIRQWQFQLGTFLGLIGAFGVVWFQPGWKTGHIALPGLLIAFTATFCWALYGILVKRPSAQLGSIRSFGLISFITSALLLPLTCVFGKISTPLHAGWHVRRILIISAVSCLALAHGVYCVPTREAGGAHAQTLELRCPAVEPARAAGHAVERLAHARIWSAAVLLFGAFLAMRVKPTVVVESVENL